ncbi:cation:proton antiporter [Pseudoprimorskyibacter insulae]|uniref:K(+)/H(+) antiporter NhaP n=1 Tax=Pseudoprimorskyibacter insulae TaxID=1695997 RepID=A0A2R8AW91_9RHOB|nr:sodium:proton antiporter [Pseudoprimorskyibacter insulae]SPF80306.1 K(+)/H(+) antiporter NhaP [Pseudoprimorskyibacter insulae]
MATAGDAAGLAPVLALGLVGALGVGSQWLAWRMRLPGIVVMLVAGLAVGPGLNIIDPARDIGDLLQPMVAIAVAIILFEGGLTLNFESLSDAARGVRRLVIYGAPLGWISSTAALHYAAGLSWESSAVFGGIMIVTGPTVIAPLLRQARLKRRPAALLQWEAIVNDPVGALAAVLAFEVVIVLRTATDAGHAVQVLLTGITVAVVLGGIGGWGLARAFRNALVPEYMKVPVLFVSVLAVFAVSDATLHESGLLAVTVMGVYIANAHLPSYAEIRRFKEHATVLLVSGVFILLAANMNRETLMSLNLRTLLFVLAVVLVARPLPVLISLAFSDVPWRERLLVAFTGPRGVVLVAVAGLFGERLVSIGIEDGASIPPLAFALVAATVVLHGFTLSPMARALGVTASSAPGVLIVGGSRWSVKLAEVLQSLELPVMIADTNRARLRMARERNLRTFYGDILSEAAEHRLDFMPYEKIIAATDNDAYNTLVATDLAPEFGRENVFQFSREKHDKARHSLPPTLGGRRLGCGDTFEAARDRIASGWEFRATGLTEEFTLANWRDMNPNGVVMAELTPQMQLRLLDDSRKPKGGAGTTIIVLVPEREKRSSVQH